MHYKKNKNNSGTHIHHPHNLYLKNYKRLLQSPGSQNAKGLGKQDDNFKENCCKRRVPSRFTAVLLTGGLHQPQSRQ